MINSLTDSMQLKIMVPDAVLLEQRITKLTAESSGGSFCLEPRHSDFVTVLVPGLLSYTLQSHESEEETTIYVAVNAGILVKHQGEVMVSVQQAVTGPELGELETLIQEHFEVTDDRERLARSAIARLESNFFRRLLVLED
ncbi:MAG: F0F1 ATP synthase subunit epsilon [Planctomycetaceae bacterium]|nr:F0F1 ATP synthase subunit epsilon [Planctomycetaceae bacterium]